MVAMQLLYTSRLRGRVKSGQIDRLEVVCISSNNFFSSGKAGLRQYQALLALSLLFLCSSQQDKVECCKPTGKRVKYCMC